MVLLGVIKKFFKCFLDPVKMGVCSNGVAVLYMLTAIYSINADVPDRALTNKALTCCLGIGIFWMIYFWILYICSVRKRWKAEGFTFSFKLDADDVV